MSFLRLEATLTPAKSNLCLSKDTGSLDILVFLAVPAGYPIIWLGYSNKKIAIYPTFREHMVL